MSPHAKILRRRLLCRQTITTSACEIAQYVDQSDCLAGRHMEHGSKGCTPLHFSAGHVGSFQQPLLVVLLTLTRFQNIKIIIMSIEDVIYGGK